MSIEQLYTIFLQYPQVQTDTRKLQKGDIYFALKGENFNGNLFAKQAIDAGASYAVIDEPTFQLNEHYILVDDVLTALQQLALYHRKQFNIPFIAITGSNGKTTTKELILAVLSAQYKTYATEGNLNNHIGIPLTLLKIKKDAEIAIIEMGANHQKEIESYCKIALPTHALINNCGKAHLEGFGGIEGVRKGKGELFDYIRETRGIIFRNTDLDYLIPMSSGIHEQITYGSSTADYRGVIESNEPLLNVAITTPKLECIIRTQLVGEYNFPNVMAAVAVGSYFKIPIEVVQKSIEHYSPSNSRSQLITQGNNTIILDAYNANPTSMAAAIRNFRNADYPNKVVMIGAMMELGEESQEEHQQIISLLEESNWNHVILVGGDFKNCQHNYIYFNSSLDASEWFKSQTFEHTAFLIKGSRAMAMEKALQ